MFNSMISFFCHLLKFPIIKCLGKPSSPSGVSASSAVTMEVLSGDSMEIRSANSGRGANVNERRAIDNLLVYIDCVDT